MSVELKFCLAEAQLDGDELAITIDYRIIREGIPGEGLTKASSQLLVTETFTTAKGLSENDVYRLAVVAPPTSVNNGYAPGDGSTSISLEFHLTDLIEVSKIRFIDGVIDYIMLH